MMHSVERLSIDNFPMHHRNNMLYADRYGLKIVVSRPYGVLLHANSKYYFNILGAFGAYIGTVTDC